MIKLLFMKVPVKKYSDVDWMRQTKDTELTRRFFISSRNFMESPRIVFNSFCKRKTHSVNKCTTVCVCVCVNIQ